MVSVLANQTGCNPLYGSLTTSGAYNTHKWYGLYIFYSNYTIF